MSSCAFARLLMGRHPHVCQRAVLSRLRLVHRRSHVFRHRGASSPLGNGLAQQAQARAQMHAGGRSAHGLEALCSAMGGGTAAARSLVDDINAALSAVSGGGGLSGHETHGACEAINL